MRMRSQRRALGLLGVLAPFAARPIRGPATHRLEHIGSAAKRAETQRDPPCGGDANHECVVVRRLGGVGGLGGQSDSRTGDPITSSTSHGLPRSRRRKVAAMRMRSERRSLGLLGVLAPLAAGPIHDRRPIASSTSDGRPNAPRGSASVHVGNSGRRRAAGVIRRGPMAWWDRVIARVRWYFGEPLSTSLRRRLRAAAPAALADLREGLHCRVAGTVRTDGGAVVRAPITDRACVAYALEVSQEDDLHSYLLVGLDKRAVPFVLEDEGHHALIVATHFQILVRDAAMLRVPRAELEPGHRELLSRVCPTFAWVDARTITFREIVIEPGARVSIAGTGHREVDPHAKDERGFRDTARHRLRFIDAPSLPLLIGDDPP